MITYRAPRDNKVYFTVKEEIEIAKIICQVIVEKNYLVHAFAICMDHVHLLLECTGNELANIVRTIKGKSAQSYKEILELPIGQPFHLWAQKFNRWLIETDDQYRNTIHYITYNRNKHNLSENQELQRIVKSITQPVYDSKFTYHTNAKL